MEIHTDPYTVRMIKKERVHDIVVVLSSLALTGIILDIFYLNFW